MNEVDKVVLLELAKKAIATKFTEEKLDLENVKHLNQPKAVFIAFYKHRNIRSGMGSFEPKPLYQAVIDTARKAAFEDPRFSPLKENDLASFKIEISVLNDIKQLTGNPDSFPDQIEIFKEGVIMKGENKGLLFPNIAKEFGYTSQQFLNALAQSAGASFNAWQKPSNIIYKFRPETFKE